MKYLLLSDIHGSLPRLQTVLDYYEREHYDMLLLLGDILNYGPRNGVPEGLDAPGIVARLNVLADQIVAVRGNCDSEVDQMLLHFPMMSDYMLLIVGGKRLMLTHGHRYNPDALTGLSVDAVIYGHTHLWLLERRGDLLACNIGSPTFPKGGNPPTFATLEEDGRLVVRTLDGAALAEAYL